MRAKYSATVSADALSHANLLLCIWTQHRAEGRPRLGRSVPAALIVARSMCFCTIPVAVMAPIIFCWTTWCGFAYLAFVPCEELWAAIIVLQACCDA